jgi:ABC-2 type transport system ATP-binding protein
MRKKSISIHQPEEEYSVARQLIDNGDDFRRTQGDIELVYTAITKGQ